MKCSSANGSPLPALRLLDTKIIFQSQRNLDPSLRHALVYILIFIFFILGVGFGGVVGIFVKLLGIPEGPAPTSVEHLSGHRSDAIDACKFLQDFVFFVFKKGFCAIFNDQLEGAIF